MTLRFVFNFMTIQLTLENFPRTNKPIGDIREEIKNSRKSARSRDTIRNNLQIWSFRIFLRKKKASSTFTQKQKILESQSLLKILHEFPKKLTFENFLQARKPQRYLLKTLIFSTFSLFLQILCETYIHIYIYICVCVCIHIYMILCEIT